MVGKSFDLRDPATQKWLAERHAMRLAGVDPDAAGYTEPPVAETSLGGQAVVLAANEPRPGYLPAPPPYSTEDTGELPPLAPFAVWGAGTGPAAATPGGGAGGGTGGTQSRTVPPWGADKPGRAARGPQEKYGFRGLEPGGTFRVPPGPDQVKWSSFQATCAIKSKSLNRKFRCHRYPDGTYEVWREW